MTRDEDDNDDDDDDDYYYDDDDEHGHACRFPKSLGTTSISVISIVLIWALCNLEVL